MRTASQMDYHAGCVLKIHPSDRQKHIIAVNDGAARSVYNLLVAYDREIHLLRKTSIYIREVAERIDYLTSVISSHSGIVNALPYLKEEDVDSMAVANAIMNYRKAWKNMKERHTGIPTFHRKSSKQSYQTNAHYRKGAESINDGNVRFEDEHHIILPKLGRIRFDGSPEVVRGLMNRRNARIGTVTISRDAVGEYWVSLQISSDDRLAEPLPETGSQAGIDLNLTDLVNDSDGESFENPRFIRAAEKKLAKAQRRLSRRAEKAKRDGRRLADSANYQKQRKKVAFIQRKTARQRADYLNCVSKQMIKNHDLIAAEDLKVKNMMQNSLLARSIGDAGWGTLLRMLVQKGETYGRQVILVPPEYTTQMCSACGHVMTGKERLPLSAREWDCPACGAHHIRDTNAAKNILARALRSL